MGDKVAWMSDGEMTSGFGPILIHIIRTSPGCGNSHPASPCAHGKENFVSWPVLESCGEPVCSIGLGVFTG